MNFLYIHTLHIYVSFWNFLEIKFIYEIILIKSIESIVIIGILEKKKKKEVISRALNSSAKINLNMDQSF